MQLEDAIGDSLRKSQLPDVHDVVKEKYYQSIFSAKLRENRSLKLERKCRQLCLKILQYISSQAVGLDNLVQSALKSIFKGDPIFESVARFFVIILKFIFIFIFEIKINEKKFLNTEKISFSKADF